MPRPSRKQAILEALAHELEQHPGDRITTAALARAVGVTDIPDVIPESLPGPIALDDVYDGKIEQAAMEALVGQNLRLQVSGLNAVGDPVTFTALLPVGEGETGQDRLVASGLEYIVNGDEVVIDNVAFGSAAAEAGFDWDQKIEEVLKPAAQPSKYWMFIPGLLVLALVVMLQRGRARPVSATAPEGA